MAEHKSNIRLTKDTTYLALTGELWGAFCEDIWENWPRYNGTALYIVSRYMMTSHGNAFRFGVFLSVLMMTSSNGNIFRVTGPLYEEFTGPGEFLTQRPVTRSFDVVFDLRLNKRLSKQSWGWWFETLSWSLWSHCNVRRNEQEIESVSL